MLWRPGRGIETWRTLWTQVWWHALRLLRLLWRRRQTRATLSRTASHDSSEKIAGAMADCWGLRLGRAAVML